VNPTATPNSQANWYFHHWEANGHATGLPFILTADTTVTAVFTQIVVQASAPVIAAVADQKVAYGTAYSLTPHLTQGYPAPTWSLVTGPNGMTINPVNGTVTWPNPQPAGQSFTVTVRATNSEGSDDETWTLQVTEAGQVAQPQFAPGGGTYSDALDVTLTCATPGAAIHYTVNGATPTESDPSVVSGGKVRVSNSLQLKARAWKDGWMESLTMEAIYSLPSTRVSITYPPDWTVLDVMTTRVDLAASTLDGLARVEWFKDGVSVGTNIFETAVNVWSNSFVWSGLKFGTNVLTAVATDQVGGATTSTPVRVVVERTRRLAFEGNLDFGKVTVGHESSRLLTLRNTGNSPCFVTSIVSSACFNVTPQRFMLPTNSSRDVTVTFRPQEPNAYTGVITARFALQSAGEANGIACSGTGTLAVELPEAVDNANLVWGTGGDADWFGQVNVTYDGIDAAQSGAVGDGQTSWVQTTVFDVGSVGFRWKVSSETNGDFLRFFVNDVEQPGALSGESGWKWCRFVLPSGTNHLRWAYEKNGSLSAGADCGWIDTFVLNPPDGTPPGGETNDETGGGTGGHGGGYLCDPADDATLMTIGSYDGYFYATDAFDGAEEASAVRGTLSLKVTHLVGKLTAKAMLQGGNVSFKGEAAWRMADGTRRAELTASGGEKLDLFVRQNRIWGTLTGGRAGAATLMLDGARNRFADRGDAEAAARLEEFKGYYTVALPAAEDSAELAPQGVGYLTIKIGNKGSAKIAGVLADGTKVSRSSRLILFDGCGPEACVPLFAPLYMKKGCVGGLLWIDPETRTVETDRDIGWFIRWENPGRVGPDGFSLLLDACGGFYGTGASLAAAYLFGAEVDDTAYFAAGEAQEWAVWPEGVPVTSSGSRLTIAKGAKPEKRSHPTYRDWVWYSYDEENPANATFSFASRTGIFRGKFSLYCDYEDASGKLIHKAVSVPYAGVLTPLRSEAFDDLPVGLGYCLVPDNDPAARALRIKRSRPVWLEEQ